MTIDGLVGTFSTRNLDDKARARIEADIAEQLRDPEDHRDADGKRPGGESRQRRRNSLRRSRRRPRRPRKTGKLLGIKAAQ